MSRHTLVRFVAWTSAAVLLAAAFLAFRGEWAATAKLAARVHPAWPLVFAGGAFVIAAYMLLVYSWRELLRDAGSVVAFRDACRMWFVSSLARYLPGALWQVGALAALAKSSGTSATAATSSAVVMTVFSVASGLVVALVAGAGALPFAAVSWQSWAEVVLGVAALSALRMYAPALMRLVSRLTEREVRLPVLSQRALFVGIAGSAIAWIAYGLGWRLLVHAVFPEMTLTFQLAIAIYAGSYLAGFLSLGPPAGLGVADGAMALLLTSTRTATPSEAVVLAAVTRLWRTSLEIAPGLFLLAARGSPRGEET